MVEDQATRENVLYRTVPGIYAVIYAPTNGMACMAWHGLQVRVCVVKDLSVFTVPVTLFWCLAPPPGNVVGLRNFTAEQLRHGFYVEGVHFHPEKQKHSNPPKQPRQTATKQPRQTNYPLYPRNCLAPKENKIVIFT